MRNKEFVLYCGPMFSGKSTKLTAVIERYRIRKSNIICFKPTIDGRYSKNQIVTHNGSKTNAIPVSSGGQILELVDVKKHEAVAVDEAFMINGSADALIELFRSNISIYVSSIELSANLKPFAEIEKIMSFATRIEKCCAVCVLCNEDATLTHRKIQSFEEISVGGAENYEPVCWRCHPLLKTHVSQKS